MKIPHKIFVKKLLAKLKQQAGETLDEFLRELCKLSKDSNFKIISTEHYHEKMISDAFINGSSFHMNCKEAYFFRLSNMQCRYLSANAETAVLMVPESKVENSLYEQ